YPDNEPLPGWTMKLHSGFGCTGVVLQIGVTNNDGLVDFTGLAPGPYSVEEVLQPGWAPIGTGVCQDVNVTALSPSDEEVRMGSRPNAPATYPPAGDDAFNSGANVQIAINGVG